MKVVNEEFSSQCSGYSSPDWLRYSSNGRYVLMADGNNVIHIDITDFTWKQIDCLSEATLRCGVPCEDGGAWLLYTNPNILVRINDAGRMVSLLPVDSGDYVWGGLLNDDDNWVVIMPSVFMSTTEVKLEILKGGERYFLTVPSPGPSDLWYYEDYFHYLTINESGVEYWRFAIGQEPHRVTNLAAPEIIAFSSDDINAGQYQKLTTGWSIGKIRYVRYANWCLEITSDIKIRNVQAGPITCPGRNPGSFLEVMGLILANDCSLIRNSFPYSNPFLLGLSTQKDQVQIATTKGFTTFINASEETLTALIREMAEEKRLDSDALAMLLQNQLPEEWLNWECFYVLIGIAFIQHEKFDRLVIEVERRILSGDRFAENLEGLTFKLLELDDKELFGDVVVRWLLGFVRAADQSAIIQDFLADIFNRILVHKERKGKVPVLLRLLLDVKPAKKGAWLESRAEVMLPTRDEAGVQLSVYRDLTVGVLNELEQPENWSEWVSHVIVNFPDDREVASVVVDVLKSSTALLCARSVQRSLSWLLDQKMMMRGGSTTFDLWLDAGLRVDWVLDGGKPLQRRLRRLANNIDDLPVCAFLMQQYYSRTSLISRLLRRLIIDISTPNNDIQPLLCLTVLPDSPDKWAGLEREEKILFSVAQIDISDRVDVQIEKLWKCFGEGGSASIRWALAMNLLSQWSSKSRAVRHKGKMSSTISPAASLLKTFETPQSHVRQELHEVACAGPDDPKLRKLVQRIIGLNRSRKTAFGEWLSTSGIEIS